MQIYMKRGDHLNETMYVDTLRHWKMNTENGRDKALRKEKVGEEKIGEDWRREKS